jgi:hypothetical protein
MFDADNRGHSSPFVTPMRRYTRIYIANRILGSRLATSGVISGRPIAQYGYDDGCFQLARKWRDTCFNKHILSCLQPMKRPLPTRVIDFSPIDDLGSPG